MVLEILCVEPIYPQYSGVLETCFALRYWFFEVLGSESVNAFRQHNLEYYDITVSKWQTFFSLCSKSIAMVMAGRSVQLTTLFPGQA